MTVSKLALSMPSDLVRQAKKEVAAGRAKSLSAFVSEAVGEKLTRNELADILDAMDETHGKPSKAATAWAKRVLGRSS
jgi:Arc/MetJ-type ribon-helix-helix transcriptional regulator